MTLWQAIRNDTVVSPIYPFARPQINQSFPLTLSIGMALPKFDCWYAACGHGSMQTTSYQNLSDKFVLDILPATITDFYNWSQLGPQIDRDGDGLPAKTDPNDRSGTPTATACPTVRAGYGLNPAVATADADGDGLADTEEVRYGTNPRGPTPTATASLTGRSQGLPRHHERPDQPHPERPAPARHRPGRAQRRRRTPPQRLRPGALSLPSPGIQ